MVIRVLSSISTYVWRQLFQRPSGLIQQVLQWVICCISERYPAVLSEPLHYAGLASASPAQRSNNLAQIQDSSYSLKDLWGA